MASAMLSQGWVRVLRAALTAIGVIVLTVVLIAIQPAPASSQCACPSQGDVNNNGFIDIGDMTVLQAIVFNNGTDVQDPNCPMSRADWDATGIVDCVDLAHVMWYLFAGGAGPAAPCTCPPGPPGVPCRDHVDEPANTVTVTSKIVSPGETGVEIPILIHNTTSNVYQLTVPLVIRELDAGSFVTSVALSFGDRLAPLASGWQITHQYADDDGSCAPAGFHTITHSDGAPHPVTSSPEGVMFSWGINAMMSQPLPIGNDVTGSLILTVDVTFTPGQFEIDTACGDPENHLVLGCSGFTPTRPTFTKGIITIQGGGCDCPYQRDFDEDHFPTAVDLSGLIGILFEGAEDVADPDCPTSRGDFNYSGFPDAVDLSRLIDELFQGGDPACDPCDPSQSTCVGP